MTPINLASISLETLLEYARQLPGQTIVGIDAAIGVPRSLLNRFQERENRPNANFLDWIQWLFDYGDPYQPVSIPADWSYRRPFIHIPPGVGSKSAFPLAGIHLHREIDSGLAANSPLIVSGLPGTVGSGSRALWQEIAEQSAHRSLKAELWPFHGRLRHLLDSGQPVVAEIYPKACYGIALSKALPAQLMTIAKTKRQARETALEQLSQNNHAGITVDSAERCRQSEDQFDAMIACIAIKRLFEAGCDQPSDHTPDIAEGDILGRWAINPAKKRRG